MDKQRQLHRTQLFVLRVWLEDLGKGQTEWRGDIQNTATREKQYFREWSALLAFMQRSCEQAQLQGGCEGDFPFRVQVRNPEEEK